MDRYKLKKAFDKYTDLTAVQGIGTYWIGQVTKFFPWKEWLAESASIQVLLWAFNIRFPIYIIILFLAMKTYLMMFGVWFGGKFVIWIGLYKAQSIYTAENEKLNPFNAKFVKTLNNICEKIDCESGFKDL